jgi:hypothetical protein
MPWCDQCNRFFSSEEAAIAAECPSCGRVVEPAEDEPGTPWHFKLLLAATVLYLGYRAVQGLAWLVHHV